MEATEGREARQQEREREKQGGEERRLEHRSNAKATTTQGKEEESRLRGAAVAHAILRHPAGAISPFPRCPFFSGAPAPQLLSILPCGATIAALPLAPRSSDVMRPPGYFSR